MNSLVIPLQILIIRFEISELIHFLQRPKELITFSTMTDGCNETNIAVTKIACFNDCIWIIITSSKKKGD